MAPQDWLLATHVVSPTEPLDDYFNVHRATFNARPRNHLIKVLRLLQASLLCSFATFLEEFIP